MAPRISITTLGVVFVVTATIAAAASAPECHLCVPYVEKSVVGGTDGSWKARLHPIDRNGCHPI